MNLGIVMAGIAAGLVGCSTTNDAVFVTKTSLSVLDVDSVPASVNVAFDRTEGYFGPRFDDGTVYPVAGYFHARGSGLLRDVRQVFAGGTAATVVLGRPNGAASDKQCSDRRKAPPLLFATGTTMGLKLGFAEGTVVPTSFTFGFRRKEAAVVPVSVECHPSVLAVLDSEAQGRTAATDPKLAFGANQYFATGAAADLLAQDPRIQEIFKLEAVKSIGPVEAFALREALQTRLALETVECAVKVPEASFDRVVVNAQELDLLLEGDPGRIRAEATAAARLQRYSALLRLRNGDVDPRTAALQMHKKRVCALAAPA